MPSELPVSSLAAKLPRATTRRGLINRSCSRRKPLHASTSAGSGSRFPGGRHFRTLTIIHVRALQAELLLDQLREQLPGGADERLALLVLVEAGRLADEHQVGAGVAHAEDGLRPDVAERDRRGTPRPPSPDARARSPRRPAPSPPAPRRAGCQPPPTNWSVGQARHAAEALGRADAAAKGIGDDIGGGHPDEVRLDINGLPVAPQNTTSPS